MNIGIRMCCIAHSQSDVWSCICRCIGGSWHQLIQIKIRIIRFVYHFLTWCGVGNFHWRDRLGHTLIQHFSKILWFTFKKRGYPLSACQKANCYLGFRVSFYIVKNHCRPFLGRTLYCAAGTYITVNSCKFCHRVYFHICFQKLSRHFF